MLKLRWPLRTKTGETKPDAPCDATGARAEVQLTAALEVIKTALVWLVVINILTVLSPLLWLPLKWAVAVGVLLTGGSAVIGGLAYMRARGMQRHLPE
jgi:hypothetical protein